MTIDRRRLLALGAAASAAAPLPALAQTPARPPLPSVLGLDAAQFGLRANSDADQTATLQRAVDQAARARAPLALAPGTYRAGDVSLPSGAHLVAARGSVRILAPPGRPLFFSSQAEQITLNGLVLDGGGSAGAPRLPERTGLVTLMHGLRNRIVDCEILGSGGHGIVLDGIGGDITGSTVNGAADVAILIYDARGLTIARNIVREAGNNGIQILRAVAGEDGTLVLDNRIDTIRNRAGGSGQFGNGVNAHRAGNVTVRGNQIHGCAFSGVRGNEASNIQITGNTVSDVGEVALYSEFGFEGAVISGNTVTRAQTGVSVSNFNVGGRLAVVQGNILRDLAMRIPGYGGGDDWGIGIYVEADTAVTGNVIEQASAAGIVAGWGRFLRDVTVSGNVVRAAKIGIGASVVPGAGNAVITGNVVAGATAGAIVGLDHLNPITRDLSGDGTQIPPNLTINGNRTN